MANKAAENEPPMATLNPMPSPGSRKSLRRSRAVIALLCLVIAVLLVLLLRPAKLDVYKTIGELEFADAALAAGGRQP